MHFLKISITFFMLLPSWVFSQGGKHCRHVLYGVVTDSETFEPLIYANVLVKDQSRGVLTGPNGEFRIEDLCDGPVTITVSHIGCETTDYTVEIAENTHFDISLPHSHNHIGEVHIVDVHPDPKRTQPEESLAGRELEEARGKSLGEALAQLNGVSALQTGASIFKPVIHGLHSNRVLVLNNGIRQEGQQWGSEHGPEIDPFIAQKLTVVKGANSVRYGADAIAGVVLVEPADLRQEPGIGGEVNLVGMSNGRMGATSGMLEGNFAGLRALSWRLQGTLKRGGNVHTPDYVLGNTGVREANFSAAAGWLKEKYGVEGFYSQFNSDIGIFSGAHIGNLTDLEAAIGRSEPLGEWDFDYAIGRPSQHIEHELSKLKAFWQTGMRSMLRLTYSRQYNLRQEYDKHTPRNDSLAALDNPELHYEVTTHSGELLWEHEVGKQVKGQIGMAGQTQKNTYDGFFLIPNYRAQSVGLFAIERLVRLRWEVEAGARFDYKYLKTWFWENGVVVSPDFNWSNFSGSLGGLYRFNQHFNVTANFATAWRPPQVNELFSDGLHHGTASIEVGDRNLRPEQAYNFSTALNYQGHEQFSGELSLYHNYIDNFIYLQPVQPPTLTIRGAFPTFHYRQVDARFTGADLKVAFSPLHNLSAELKASVLRAWNITANEYLILMPADNFSGSLSYQFKDGRRLLDPYVSGSYTYTRRQTRAPLDQDYLAPPDAYGLLSFAAGGSFKLGKQTIDLGFSVNNALNTSYRNYLNRFRYFADEIGRNYSFRIKIPFNLPSK